MQRMPRFVFQKLTSGLLICMLLAGSASSAMSNEDFSDATYSCVLTNLSYLTSNFDEPYKKTIPISGKFYIPA